MAIPYPAPIQMRQAFVNQFSCKINEFGKQMKILISIWSLLFGAQPELTYSKEHSAYSISLHTSLTQDFQAGMAACYGPAQCVTGQKRGACLLIRTLPELLVFDTSMLFYCTGQYLKLALKTTQKYQLVQNTATHILSRKELLSL